MIFLLDKIISLLSYWKTTIEKRAIERQFGARRSPYWNKVRKEFLRKNPVCAITGSKRDLEIHHLKDFSHYPELELAEENLVTLRRDIHFIFGHYSNWASINSKLPEDIKEWRERIKNRI